MKSRVQLKEKTTGEQNYSRFSYYGLQQGFGLDFLPQPWKMMKPSIHDKDKQDLQYLIAKQPKKKPSRCHVPFSTDPLNGSGPDNLRRRRFFLTRLWNFKVASPAKAKLNCPGAKWPRLVFDVFFGHIAVKHWALITRRCMCRTHDFPEPARNTQCIREYTRNMKCCCRCGCGFCC